MQNAAGGASVQPDRRNDNFNSIVSDLVSLVAHVQTSMKLLESAIAGELPLGNQEIAKNVIVLDDVTPRYVKAGAALNACNAGLGVALHFLLDSKTGAFAASARPGARASDRA